MAVNGVEITLVSKWRNGRGNICEVTGYSPGARFCWQVKEVFDGVGCLAYFVDDNGVALRKLHTGAYNLATPVDDIRIPEHCTLFDAQTVNMSAPGYASLANVLQMAYNQAAVGKGVERHAAVGEPFHQQVMQIGAAKFGVGALLFQAFKKSEESQRLEHDRAVNELLGAIVYLAGAVIALEKAKVSK